MSWDVVVVVETVESANQLQYLALLSYTKRSTNYILERKQSVVCNKYIVCTSWYTIGRFLGFLTRHTAHQGPPRSTPRARDQKITQIKFSRNNYNSVL